MAFNWRKFPWTNLHDLNLDWIIQTVKTLEDNLADAVSTFQEMINKAITNTLTGSGDLTINKTGDVNITGRSVTIYPVKIPTDIVDIGEYAANCGFVSMEVENMTTMLDNDIDTERAERLAGDAAIQTALSTETENRKSGDAAIQTAIEHEIKPKLVRDFHVTGTDDQNGYITGVTFADGYPKSGLDNLIAQNAEIRLVVETPGSSLYFNICRPWGNNYIGFSGIVQLALGVASQIIGYNGTDFTVYGNNAT